MPRTYAILGAGGLGGYYGALLHHAGHDVHWLLHSDYDHVRAHGLKVQTTRGDRSIDHPRVYRRPRDMPRCDVALVALKTTQNHLLADLLPHVTAGDGLVLVMQNGLGNEEQAAAIVGDRVVGGVAFLCSNKVGPGHIHQLDYGHVLLGPPGGAPPAIRAAADAIASDFRGAGVDVTASDDLLLARWKKLVWNVPFNGLAVVLDAATDQIMRDPVSRARAEALMWEVVAGAGACGRTIDAAFVERMMETTDKMVVYRPSMKIDYDERRPMELEAIYGNPIRLAAAHGTDLPRMTALYEQLKVLDARHQR